jgi:hypothetical protein
MQGGRNKRPTSNFAGIKPVLKPAFRKPTTFSVSRGTGTRLSRSTRDNNQDRAKFGNFGKSQQFAGIFGNSLEVVEASQAQG